MASCGCSSIVCRCCDALAGRERVDLIADFAYELPALVIFLLLGIPDEDAPKIKKWADNRLLFTFGELDDAGQMRAAEQMLDYWKYCVALVEARKRSPGTDYASKLLAMRAGDDARLSENEIASLVFGLLTFIIPQSLGTLLGRCVLHMEWPEAILLASMFSSHTLLTFPVVGKLGLAKSRSVTTVIGGTIITDTLALLLLSVIASTTRGEVTADVTSAHALTGDQVVALHRQRGVVTPLVGVADLGPELRQLLQRLDAECSGLVVAARTEEAYRTLKREASRQRLVGSYMALVEGRLTETGEIEAPIGNLKHEREQASVMREGRAARTHYRAVHHYRDEGRYYTLLEVVPESARLHQVRVHLAWYGYPVVGDRLYGSQRQPDWVTRLYLHLSELTFQHPLTGAMMALDSPLPAEIYGVLHFMARRKR